MASRSAQSLDEALNQVSQPQPLSTAAKASIEMMEAEKQSKEFMTEIRGEELVSLNLAPLYQPYFGEIMSVYLNGFPIFFPVNGKTYQVPKSYAAVIQERRRRVDDMIAKRRQMADVSKNFESYAGELKLLPR